jgi:prevent-host-death family protein
MPRPTYSTYDAKARFSEILRQVRAGTCVLISYRGLEVAEIRPIETIDTVKARFERLERSGVLSSGDRLLGTEGKLEPVASRSGALERFLASKEPRP